MNQKQIQRPMGTIKVNLESDSVFFNHNVPIEIRDSQMRSGPTVRPWSTIRIT